MKKITIFIIFLTLISLLLNCNKSPRCWGKKEISNGIIEADFDPSLNCNILVNQDSSFVINTENEYQQLAYLAHGLNTNCNFEIINFNNYTLLGKTIWTTCKSKIKRNVTDDTENHFYIYTIELIECGNCIEQKMVENWILVPKIPPGYSVKFVFIKK